jgi:two-component sensor histidine kinase
LRIISFASSEPAMFFTRILPVLCCIFPLQTLSAQQRFATAEDSLRHPLRMAKDDTSRITAYVHLANYFFYNDMKHGQMLMDSAAQLAEKYVQEPQYWQILYYQRQATMYYRNGEMHKAYDAHLARLKVGEKLGLKETVASTKGYIGMMYTEMGDYQKSIKVLKESIVELEAIGAYKRTPIQYHNLAEAYRRLKDSSHLVQPNLEKALALLDKYPNSVTEIRVLTALIRVYIYRDQVQNIKNIFPRLESATQKANDLDGKAYMSLSKGMIAMNAGQYEVAEQHIFDFLRTSGTIFYRFNLSTGYEMLAKLYKKQGNHKAALEYVEKKFLLEDTIKDLEKAKYARMLSVEYENEKKETALKQKEDELVQAGRIQWFLLSGSALLSFFLFLLYKQNRAKQSAYKKLAASNNKVKQQAEELQLMMRELHHRVKNNLQIIASLLNLQAYKTGDESTAAVILEGKSRVEAMALIHQRLYNTSNIDIVDFNQYASDLLEKVRFAYGYSDKNLNSNIDIDIDSGNLEVDSAIPLGLILNELLTNSFKHGFQEEFKEPNLNISLKKNGKQYFFEYSDNGKGIENIALREKNPGFGMQLITALSKQLKGRHRFWNQNGAFFELHFG